MSTQVKKRSDQIAADQALLAGVQKFLVQYPSLYVGGQSMTPSAIVTALQNRINANQAAQAAEVAHHDRTRRRHHLLRIRRATDHGGRRHAARKV